MENETQKYYILTSQFSRNATTGLGKISTRTAAVGEIIRWAEGDAGRQGDTLETFAGIGWVGAGDPDEDGDYPDFVPERGWREGEQLAAAVDWMQRDGKMFEVFPRTAQGRTDYLARCEALDVAPVEGEG